MTVPSLVFPYLQRRMKVIRLQQVTVLKRSCNLVCKCSDWGRVFQVVLSEWMMESLRSYIKKINSNGQILRPVKEIQEIAVHELQDIFKAGQVLAIWKCLKNALTFHFPLRRIISLLAFFNYRMTDLF